MSARTFGSRGRTYVRLLTCVATCLAAPWVTAETLTVEAALQRSLAAHPELRAAALTTTALHWQGAAETQPPPIRLGLELENLGGTGALSGIHASETTLSLSRTFERGGKAQARQARSDARIATHTQRQALLRLDLELRVRQRHVALLHVQALRDLADAQHALARATQAALEDRVRRGAAADSELDWARIGVAETELVLEHARHERRAAAFALAALWGATHPTELEAAGDLFALPEVGAFADWDARLTHSAEFALQDQTALELDAETTLARAAAHADWEAGVGIRRLEALDDQAVVLSFSVPLGHARSSAPLLAQRSAERAAHDALSESLRLDARQRLYAGVQELNHARSEAERLDRAMLPAAARALDATRSGFDQGRYGVLQLAQAQATVLRLQQARLAAAARFHTLWAELQRSVAHLETQP